MYILGALGSATVTEFGKLLGQFPANSDHDVAGTIYVVDETTIWVRGFSYDGAAPDAFFYGGDTPNPSENGVIIPDELGTTMKLGMYDDQNLILTLPTGKTITDFKWISIWCRLVGANFGHVDVPSDFAAPAMVSLGELMLNPIVHGTRADDVIVLNTRQFKFINLEYDGRGPAAYFWVDQGTNPSTSGKRVPHEDDRGGDRLPMYDGATVIVTLPEGETVTDYGNIGLWCEAARQNFGHVVIPSDLVVPPYMSNTVGSDNCKVLVEDKFHIGWTVDEANNKITLEFIGAVDIREYMAFGISGSDSETNMVGSDVTVVFIDSDNRPKSADYLLNAYSQCTVNNGVGACPDILQGGTDDVVLQGGFIRNGVTRITVERPLNTSDTNDKDIPLDASTFISWGIGDINPTGHVSKHDIRADGNVEVNFGTPSSKCPNLVAPRPGDGNIEAWEIEPLVLSPDEAVTAHIGPSGGAQGYKAIADQVGWGIAWYINGQLVPEITVKRNYTYTFNIYGGNDDSQLATYHPFYIQRQDGGFAQKTIKKRW
ncbi:hypothetical protein BSL78_10703 [Apostichopus japonicus]|uniref:Protein Skeletor n=1 Tax=Stichopus japonicus TaxID=307972 RepID=A0A2G8KWL9_STIJA|nr:hypothetical protein BSL78_10703 [Apostichopus japonicus]